MTHLNIIDHPDGATLQLRVKPKASRTAILGCLDGALVVALAAPPVDGEANSALIKALAKWTHLPSSNVTLHSGAKSKHKLLKFAGLSAKDLQVRLQPHLPNSGKP